jgi:hypothetical protein
MLAFPWLYWLELVFLIDCEATEKAAIGAFLFLFLLLLPFSVFDWRKLRERAR